MHQIKRRKSVVSSLCLRERFSALDVCLTITILANVSKKRNDSNRCWHNKQMPNGSVQMLKYVHGARKLWRGRWVATSWLALVARIFVICVLDLGSQTTKIISSAIFTRKNQTRWSTVRKRSCKRLIIAPRDLCSTRR